MSMNSICFVVNTASIGDSLWLATLVKCSALERLMDSSLNIIEAMHVDPLS